MIIFIFLGQSLQSVFVFSAFTIHTVSHTAVFKHNCSVFFTLTEHLSWTKANWFNGLLKGTKNITEHILHFLCQDVCSPFVERMHDIRQVRVISEFSQFRFDEVLCSMLVLIFRGNNGMDFTGVKEPKSDNKIYCKGNSS